MQHVEDRPEYYQPFTQLGSHYTWSRLGGVMWNVKLHTWYEFQTSPEMLPDKRCWLMTSSFWLHDPCLLYKLETILWFQRRLRNDVLIDFFYQGDLLVKVSGCYRHWILRYDMVLAFPCNSCLVSFDCLKNKILRACALHMISKCFWLKFVH